MYKWKNNFGGVGQIDARWLTTRTLLGVGISFVAFMIGQGINLLFDLFDFQFAFFYYYFCFFVFIFLVENPIPFFNDKN